MTSPFASAADLATRLKVAAFTGTALEQVNALLEDASAHLRDIIGWQVYPPATVTQQIRTDGTAALPLLGGPIVEVTDVSVDGVALADGFVLMDGRLRRGTGYSDAYGWVGTIDVNYTVGYEVPPPNLVAWTCVLASQALSTSNDLGALGSGEVSSLQLGPDYRIAWTQGEGAATLPQRVEDLLRTCYGSGVYVTSG